MPTTNPYLNRQPISQPNEFFGRARDVRWLLERIMHPTVPQCCSITGLRRIGKSSLLRFLEHPEGARLRYPDYFGGQARVLLVYVDLSREGGEPTEDGEALVRGTLRHVLQSLARKTRKQVDAALAETIRALRDGSGDTWHGLLEALDEALYRLTEEGYRVIFLLDEMDVATAWHPRLAQVLRALVMEYNVAYVTASLDPLFELLDEGRTSPLYNLFSSRPLGLLEPGDARCLLTEPARHLGVTWPDELTDQLLDAAGGHPDLLKRAASHVWDLLRTTGEPPIIRLVKEALKPDANALFTSIWDHLSKTERQVVAAMATGQGVLGEAGGLLPALQQRAILVESLQGPQLFGHLFAEWAQHQDEGAAHEGEPRLEGRWLYIDGDKKQLTPTEVKLARALLLRRGQTVPREELQRAIWAEELSADSKALDTTVQRLRGKIEKDRNNPHWLVTVRGEGYMFRDV